MTPLAMESLVSSGAIPNCFWTDSVCSFRSRRPKFRSIEKWGAVSFFACRCSFVTNDFVSPSEEDDSNVIEPIENARMGTSLDDGRLGNVKGNMKRTTLKSVWRKGDCIGTTLKSVWRKGDCIGTTERVKQSRKPVLKLNLEPVRVSNTKPSSGKNSEKQMEVGENGMLIEELTTNLAVNEEDVEKLEDRPPVITVMGHVDHGKMTLLDYIRRSKMATSEAGGITQGIGAYNVLVPIAGKPQPCVFLDTPGHELFGEMRARGARVTDIAVVVVAADDGIRPQTSEAVAHAKAAGVPIVIAINKIDKDGANPDQVMQELSQMGLMPKDWGGDIPMVKISALKGENIGELLETIMLVAEMQELKANPHRNAKGTVIEAGLHKFKGHISTFIVQNGTLKTGDVVVCGEAFGKVRALFDEGRNRVYEAAPSIPVQVIGLNNVTVPGDEFEVVGSLNIAHEKAEACAEALRNEHLVAKAEDGKITLSSFTSAVASGKLSGLDLHQLNIILKVDLQGSIEAVREALQVLPQDNVTLNFLMQATGDVSSSDVDLAVASKAIILGFSVKVPGSVKKHADDKGVVIRLYRVIYELIDDVRNAMEGLLESVQVSRHNENHGDAMEWTEEGEKYFIEILADRVKRDPNGAPIIKSIDWMEIDELIFLKISLRYGAEKLKGKYYRLRSLHTKFSELINNTDVTWDSNSGKVFANDALWDDYLKRSKIFKTIKKKGCKLYPLLNVVFSNSATFS